MLPNKEGYSITLEIVNPTGGLQKELFVVERIDTLSSDVEYSRVASLTDLKVLKRSGVTEQTSYLVSKVVIKTNSLLLINEYRQGVPLMLKSLLDSVSKGLLNLINLDETIPIEGTNE